MSKKIVVDTVLRDTLQDLQQDPRRYKLFGIYGWPMKTPASLPNQATVVQGALKRDARSKTEAKCDVR